MKKSHIILAFLVVAAATLAGTQMSGCGTGVNWGASKFALKGASS